MVLGDHVDGPTVKAGRIDGEVDGNHQGHDDVEGEGGDKGGYHTSHSSEGPESAHDVPEQSFNGGEFLWCCASENLQGGIDHGRQ